MAKNSSVLTGLLLAVLLVGQCCSQLTFSRNWEAPGGKRSDGHALIFGGNVPATYYKAAAAANGVCQYLLAEIKQMNPCDSRSEEAAPIYQTN